MTDNGCCLCEFSIHVVNETDDGNYIVCLKGHNITDDAVFNMPCIDFIKMIVH